MTTAATERDEPPAFVREAFENARQILSEERPLTAREAEGLNEIFQRVEALDQGTLLELQAIYVRIDRFRREQVEKDRQAAAAREEKARTARAEARTERWRRLTPEQRAAHLVSDEFGPATAAPFLRFADLAAKGDATAAETPPFWERW